MPSKHNIPIQILDPLFQKTISKLPGKQLISCVFDGDGSLIWGGAEGMAEDGSPIDVGTPFFIASVDKLINTALLLKLAEEGLVNLDAPMADYLPDTLINGLHVLKGKDHTASITVRHLLTHTSGLADWYEDFPANGTNLVEEIISSGDRNLSLDAMMEYVRSRLRPNFPPQPIDALKNRSSYGDGASFVTGFITRYTDTGFMLIGALLQELTGQPLEQLHHERIYKPLGLQRTWLVGRTAPEVSAPSKLPLLASGARVEIPLMLRSVWGVYSTCSDMARFLMGLYKGEIFQKPETRWLMFSGWHRFGFPTDKAAIRLPGWPIAYGHGAMHFKLPRLFTPLKPMPAIVGHTGSTGCWLFYCPERDLYFVGAADDLTAGALPFRHVPALLKAIG